MALVATLLLGGCATRPTDPEELAYYIETRDPLEPFNRAVFQFNEITDKVVLRPLAIGYRAIVPSGIRAGIHNFLNNLKSPTTIINALLQGEGERARDTFGRFLTNTILGLGGFIDIASDAGIPQYYEDLGQTLAVWGVEPGPYLVMPILGPADLRHWVGYSVDGAISPTGYYIRKEYGMEGVGVQAGLSALDWRSANLETVDDLRKSSLDFYATVRSAYRQRRQHEIWNGEQPKGDSFGGPEMIDFDKMDMDMELPPEEAPENGPVNEQ